MKLRKIESYLEIYTQLDNISSIQHGLGVSIAGFHPAGPGTILNKIRNMSFLKDMEKNMSLSTNNSIRDVLSHGIFDKISFMPYF